MKVDANGVQIHYEVAGESGPAVLLVHGLGGNAGQWHDVAASLSPSCRVVLMDMRGHGESDKPAAVYSIKMFSDDMAAVCRAAGVERCVAVGASVAGAAVVQFAADHPDLARGIVPVGGTVALPQAGRDRMNQRAAEVESKGMAAVADAVCAASLGPATHASNPSQVNALKALLLSNDPKAYAAGARAVALTDVSAALPRVKCPAMIVFGADEKVAPLGAQSALKKGLPHATLRVIPAAGHLAFIEQPALFVAALLEFLAALP